MKTPKWVRYARKHYDDLEQQAWEDPILFAERHFYRCCETKDVRLFEASITLLRMMRKIADGIPRGHESVSISGGTQEQHARGSQADSDAG